MASKISTNITSDLAIETLKEAIITHKPSAGLILHSDQGSHYTSKAFTDFCSTNNVKQSMSKAGCPYDNVFRYYHHKRPHSSLGGLTPFEKRYL